MKTYIIIFLLSIKLTSVYGQSTLQHTPLSPQSQMVSDAYAEISWSEGNAGETYLIEIREKENKPLLVQELVWTSFYFRVLDMQSEYQYRIAIKSADQPPVWTEWVHLNTKVD